MTGLEAWAAVLWAMRRVGRHRTPYFENPVLAECVAVFGWRDLCSTDVDDAATRDFFIRTYEERAAATAAKEGA